MWKSGRNINSRRAALAEGYMEDTQESRGRKFSGSTAMILGLFITLELMIGGAMIFNYDFQDRKSTRLNSSHTQKSRMPSSA